MITFFAVPKPFHGHIEIIQRNAIRSWTLLQPSCEVILFGDEDGTAEVAAELGIRHISEVACNEYGTPLLGDIFKQAEQIAKNDLLCYVNADIILLSGFVQATSRVARKKQQFLIGGQRWNLDLARPLIFDEDWEEDIKALLKQFGVLSSKKGIDYFVFPKGLLWDFPQFAVGRPGWDNWIIYKARTRNYSVVDASKVITAVHQKHDYYHIPKGDGVTYEGPEADINRSLIGGKFCEYNLCDANYLLTDKWLRPALMYKIYRPIRNLKFRLFYLYCDLIKHDLKPDAKI